jgi:hypothetical protein
LPRSSLSRASVAATLAATLLAAQAAGAAGDRRWIADSGDEVATLIYGTPESDDMLFSLVCERASKMLTVWFAPQPTPVKELDRMPMILSSETGQLRLVADGSHSDIDDSYSLQTQTPLTPELETLLAGARKLSIKVENRTMDMAIDDIALKGAEELIAACRK